MSIHEFEMTVEDMTGEEVEINVIIESAHRSKGSFYEPPEEEIDFWIEDFEGNEVEVSQKTWDKIESKCWIELADAAEEAKTEMAISYYESRRYADV